MASLLDIAREAHENISLAGSSGITLQDALARTRIDSAASPAVYAYLVKQLVLSELYLFDNEEINISALSLPNAEPVNSSLSSKNSSDKTNCSQNMANRCLDRCVAGDQSTHLSSEVRRLVDSHALVKVSVRHVMHTYVARGVSCLDEVSFEPAAYILDSISNSKSKGVLLMDLNARLGGKSSANIHAGRLVSFGLVQKRRVISANRVGKSPLKTMVLHLARYARDYCPEQHGYKLEAGEDCKSTVINTLVWVLRSLNVRSLSLNELCRRVGLHWRSGYSIKYFLDTLVKRDSSEHVPLVVFDPNKPEPFTNDAHFSFNRWHIGTRLNEPCASLANDSALFNSNTMSVAEEVEDFGSKIVFNMPLYEQCASYLCESAGGLSSTEISEDLGLDRKKSSSVVSEFVSVYSVAAVKIQEGKQQAFRLQPRVLGYGSYGSERKSSTACAVNSRPDISSLSQVVAPRGTEVDESDVLDEERVDADAVEAHKKLRRESVLELLSAEGWATFEEILMHLRRKVKTRVDRRVLLRTIADMSKSEYALSTMDVELPDGMTYMGKPCVPIVFMNSEDLEELLSKVRLVVAHRANKEDKKSDVKKPMRVQKNHRKNMSDEERDSGCSVDKAGSDDCDDDSVKGKRNQKVTLKQRRRSRYEVKVAAEKLAAEKVEVLKTRKAKQAVKKDEVVAPMVPILPKDMYWDAVFEGLDDALSLAVSIDRRREYIDQCAGKMNFKEFTEFYAGYIPPGVVVAAKSLHEVIYYHFVLLFSPTFPNALVLPFTIDELLGKADRLDDIDVAFFTDAIKYSTAPFATLTGRGERFEDLKTYFRGKIYESLVVLECLNFIQSSGGWGSSSFGDRLDEVLDVGGEIIYANASVSTLGFKSAGFLSCIWDTILSFGKKKLEHTALENLSNTEFLFNLERLFSETPEGDADAWCSPSNSSRTLRKRKLQADAPHTLKRRRIGEDGVEDGDASEDEVGEVSTREYSEEWTEEEDCSLIEVYIGFYLQRKSGRLPIKYRMERFTHNATLPSAVLLFKDFDVAEFKSAPYTLTKSVAKNVPTHSLIQCRIRIVNLIRQYPSLRDLVSIIVSANRGRISSDVVSSINAVIDTEEALQSWKLHRSPLESAVMTCIFSAYADNCSIETRRMHINRIEAAVPETVFKRALEELFNYNYIRLKKIDDKSEANERDFELTAYFSKFFDQGLGAPMFGLVSASGDPTAPSTQSLLLAHSVANSLCNVEIVYNADEETGQLHDPVGDAQDDADDAQQRENFFEKQLGTFRVSFDAPEASIKSIPANTTARDNSAALSRDPRQLSPELRGIVELAESKGAWGLPLSDVQHAIIDMTGVDIASAVETLVASKWVSAHTDEAGVPFVVHHSFTWIYDLHDTGPWITCSGGFNAIAFDLFKSKVCGLLALKPGASRKAIKEELVVLTTNQTQVLLCRLEELGVITSRDLPTSAQVSLFETRPSASSGSVSESVYALATSLFY